MPKFSVIIPCHNAERFVGSAIRSCLDQTVEDLEVIVVDDGSTDRSFAEIKAVAAGDKRVVLHRQVNRGPGAARNVGLHSARGEYLNFLDADDMFEHTKLAKQGELLDEDPALGMVLCDGVFIDEDGAVAKGRLLQPHRFHGPADLFAVLFSGGQFPPLVPLIRRKLALDAGGMAEDRRLAGWADTEFWLRVALQCAAYQVIEEPLCRYRQHSANMSGDKTEMEQAARHVYASLMSSFPTECAKALRLCQRRLVDLEFGLRHLRRVLDQQIGLRRTAEANLGAWKGRELDTVLRRIITTAEDKSQGSRLLVWGAGSGGCRVERLITQRGGRLAAFVDSDPRKAGIEVQGIPVVPPTAIGRDAFVVVASSYSDAIASQLLSDGYVRDVDFVTVDFVAVAALEAQNGGANE